MDPVMAKLNEAIVQKVGQSSGISVSGVQPKPEEVSIGRGKFDQTLADKMLERINGETQMSPTASSGLSAEGITIREKGDVEAAIRSGDFTEEPLGDRFFSAFKDMNRDLVGLEATVEILANDNIKLTLPQALALQAGSANVMIYTEAFSHFVDVVGRSIQQITSTQV